MQFLNNIWMIINEFAPYLILGCLVSGLLSLFLSVEVVQKYLGKSNFLSVVFASVLGVPMPLCSCGVIPVSAYLKKHGASNGATTSFLISTPQTGIDSIFITYGMLGPFFAIYRPIVAFISGIIGGGAVHLFDKDTSTHDDISCKDDCCDDNSNKSAIYKILHYGFIRLPLDIVNPLIIGILLSALIIVLIPSNYFELYGSGFSGMLIMLVLGLPTYVCATASVPLAFALYTKGFSLGAMLVFLMTGPATNVTTMSVIYKVLGRKNLLIYLMSIAFCAVSAGLFLDYIYSPDELIISNLDASHLITGNMKFIFSIFLILILINSLRIKYFSSHSNAVNEKNLKSLSVDGMTCSHCEESVKKNMLKIRGITNVNIDLSTGKIIYSDANDSLQEIIDSITSLGYKIK